jgi:hypothetical protein
MAFAPQPHLSACLQVLRSVTLEARLIGNSGEKDGLTADDAKQLADLMDAVENIPDLLTRWEDCDEAWLRRDLKSYDDRWGTRSAFRLLEVYDRHFGAG